MKKTVNGGVGHNKTRARLVAQTKAQQREELKLKAKREKFTKVILIGSAALSAIALGFFANNKHNRKKKGLLNW